MLATLSRVLHHSVIPPRDHQQTVHPGSFPRHLLARDVEQHVQSHNLLLDEFQVKCILKQHVSTLNRHVEKVYPRKFSESFARIEDFEVRIGKENYTRYVTG